MPAQPLYSDKLPLHLISTSAVFKKKARTVYYWTSSSRCEITLLQEGGLWMATSPSAAVLIAGKTPSLCQYRFSEPLLSFHLDFFPCPARCTAGVPPKPPVTPVRGLWDISGRLLICNSTIKAFNPLEGRKESWWIFITNQWANLPRHQLVSTALFFGPSPFGLCWWCTALINFVVLFF